MENKVSNMWKSFLPSIVVFALQLAFSYIGMFLVFCLQAHHYTGGGFKKFIQSYYKVVTSTDFNVLVMLVYAVIATVLFSLWYYKKVRDKEKDQPAFAAFQKQPLYFVPGALLLAFGMQYLCTCFDLNASRPIAKGDLKWRDALLVAHRVNSNERTDGEA